MASRAALTGLVLSLVWVSSCGGDEFSNSGGSGGADASAGGTAGDAGDSGTSGSSATGGTGGGTGGSGGRGAVGGEGGSSGSSGAAGTAGSAGSGGTEPTCNPDEAPVGDAVFVSPTGSDSQAGTALLPVQSLPKAITMAKAALAKHIYMEVGNYTIADTLDFGSGDGGLIIEGGWARTGGTWRPVCQPARRDLSIVTVESETAVRVSGTTAAPSLRHMVISTRAEAPNVPGQSGASVYGVHVSGAGTVFNLHDVRIIAGHAADGGELANTPVATGLASCDGVNGCCTNATAGCGDGTSGPQPPVQAAPAGPTQELGKFTSQGYVAGKGNDGPAGAVGFNGKAGGPGESPSGAKCRVGGDCGTCLPTCLPDPGTATCQNGTAPTSTPPLVGGSGKCGCAGLGGNSGSGGLGGGASVALFVADGAQVGVSWSLLQAGDGGAGGIGAKGGLGAPGGPGTVGADVTCATGCHDQCFGSCACTISTTAKGGTAGTKGGRGGTAGDGGGGPGGPSHTIVVVSAGFADLGNNLLEVGQGGIGANGSVSGPASPLLQL